MRNASFPAYILRISLLFALSCFLFFSCARINTEDEDNGIPDGLIDYIKASNTEAGDKFGFSIALSADGDTLAVSAPHEDSSSRGVKQPGDPDYDSSQSNNSATDSGAVYIFTRSDDTWLQQAYLKGSNSDSGDNFGHSISISDDGNTLAVAAIHEDGNSLGGEGDNSVTSSGAVYIFSRSGDAWSPEFYVKASNPDTTDQFGNAISLSGDGLTLAVGAKNEDSGIIDGPVDNSVENSGAVYIFEKSATLWSQQAYLKAVLMDIEDNLGQSVALSEDGDTLIVGVPGDDSGSTIPSDNSVTDSGAFYIFNRSGIDWGTQAYFKPSTILENARIGFFVTISSEGTVAAVGGGTANVGETVYLFGGSGTSWVESLLTVEAPNQEFEDTLGVVALSGNGLVLAAGAYGEDSSATGVDGNQSDNSALSSGAAYLFRDNGTNRFYFDSYIKASNTESNDVFGGPLALSDAGYTMAVSAVFESSNAVGINGDRNDNSAPNSGAVYIYNFTDPGDDDDDDDDIPAGLIDYIKASNTEAGDEFGYAIALSADGDTLAVGAPYEDSSARGVKQPGDADYDSSQSDNSGQASGAVYIFSRTGDVWEQQAYLKASNADYGDQFGFTVSLSDDGNTLAVGAPLENGNGIGGEVDNSLSASGAVYIFSRSGDTWYYDFYVKPSNPDSIDQFGYSLSLSGEGTTLAVGARNEDSGVIDGPDDNSVENSGAVYIFENSASFWYQQVYLKASIMDADDQFGFAVSLSDDGNTLMVGVHNEDSGNVTPADNSEEDSGAFYIFNRSGSDWPAQAYFKTSNISLYAQVGSFVSLSGDGTIAAVGEGASFGDAAYVFAGSGISWVESLFPVEAPNQEVSDKFETVALSGDGLVLAVGAIGEDSNATGIDGNQNDNSAISSGAVYLFRNNGTGRFFFDNYIKASNTDTSDQFGNSVALSETGYTLAVGAISEDSSATGIGGDQNDNSALKSGAIYIYNF